MKKGHLLLKITALVFILTIVILSTAQVKAASKTPVVLKCWIVNFADVIEIWRLLTEDLEKVGIQVDLKTGTISEWVGEIVKPNKHPYHLVTLVWGSSPDRAEPSYFLTEFFHSSRAKEGGRNYGGFINREYDEIINAQIREMDRGKRQQLIWKAQELINKHNVFFPIYHRDYIQAYNVDRIANVVPVIGSCIGMPYSPWTFLMAEPKTKVKEPRVVGKNDLVTLNPFAVSQTQNEHWLRFTYDTFVKRGKNLEIVPWAAKSWNVIDEKTVDITLRSGMTFHDGMPVTVEDAKFTFDYILKWKFPALSTIWGNIDSVTILDKNVLRFKLEQPYAPFVSYILMTSFIAPKHIWEKIPESVGINNPQEWSNDNPIGSGPFKFDKWRKGEYFHLIANKKHWMAPKFEGLYYILVPSIENQMAMLERKEAEILGWFVDKKQAEKLNSFKHLKSIGAPGFGIHEIRPNMRLRPTNDPAFRQAFQHLVNRKRMLEVCYEGAGTVCRNTPISPLIEFWHNPNIPLVEYDVEKARQILKEAGYSWNEKGLLCYP
ncbi:MAG: hypothetical protein JRJ70_07355 [Deltaproteobacteria bacterium]|nr:hypothetical protein [Deltaproteobacteria bacterium]